MSWGGAGPGRAVLQDSPEAALEPPLAIASPAVLGGAMSCPESLWERCQGSAPHSGVLWVVQAASESSHNALKVSADGKMGSVKTCPGQGGTECCLGSAMVWLRLSVPVTGRLPPGAVLLQSLCTQSTERNWALP